MTRFPTPHIPVLFSLLDRVHGKLLNKYILNPTHNRQDRHVLCPHKAEETDKLDGKSPSRAIPDATDHHYPSPLYMTHGIGQECPLQKMETHVNNS